MTANPHRIPARLPLTLSEAQFQNTVIDTAILFGWHVHHSRPAQVRPGKFVTAVQGHVGLPDLVLARDGVVLLAELKRHNANPTPSQRAWGVALGAHYRLWRPGDWAVIVSTLRHGPDRLEALA